MFDFHSISPETFLGRVFRLPLRLVPRGKLVRILFGRNRGALWKIGSGTHGCWIGTYEADQQEAMALELEHFGDQPVIYDVGANAGFYTLLLSRIRPRAKIFSFEPVPENFRDLEQHVQVNGRSGVVPLLAAIGARSGVAKFSRGENPATGKLSDDGSFDVRVIGIDEAISRSELPPADFIKMDIEGAEFEALSGATGLLRSRRPTVFLATHGEGIAEQCRSLLISLGYDITCCNGKPDTFICRPHAAQEARSR